MWLMTPRETEKSWKRVIARISYGSQSTQHTIIQGEIDKSWKRVLARISYGSQSYLPIQEKKCYTTYRYSPKDKGTKQNVLITPG